jgi:hypothetical protein
MEFFKKIKKKKNYQFFKSKNKIDFFDFFLCKANVSPIHPKIKWLITLIKCTNTTVDVTLHTSKGNNKITELRAILQRESQNS